MLLAAGCAAPGGRGAAPAGPAPARAGAQPAASDTATDAGAEPGFGFHVRGRSGLSGAWERFRPCVGLAAERCDGGAVPRLAPELVLGVSGGGVLLDRVRVAVDYDAAREFSASNDIRISYEGQAGEVLRRVEAGSVALRLPAARYLGAHVPAGSWGLRAVAQAGPLELQALWAQGGGEVATREFRLNAGRAAVLQEASVARDDADYAAGQFFFLFDPAHIRGHPHLDILTLGSGDAPAERVPAAGVRLYRYEALPPARDGSTVMLRALPEAASDAAEAVSGPFRLLQEGVDYELHHSGLWLVLRQPLRPEEALGVAYRTAAGGWVGDSPGSAGEALPRIRLLRAPLPAHRPGSATWPLEMRQVYRVAASGDVDAGSVRLAIFRGEPGGGDLGRPDPRTGALIPYLQLLGLDDDPPREQLDRARLYRPAEPAAATGAVDGVFVVFPTLRPFAAPPPLRGLNLSAAEAAAVLGEAANPAIYEAIDERERRLSARFRLHFRYATRDAAAPSAVSLGAIGIREGSERVYLGGRLLQRGTDYELLYETGELRLHAPAAPPGAAEAELRVSFEQLPLFAAAPTRLAALTARLPLGERGELNLVGLSQQQRTLLRRPPLGAEAGSLLLGGATGRLRWGLPVLDRALGLAPRPQPAVPPGASGLQLERVAAPAAARSELRVDAELAVSLPDAGGAALAYLDDFEDRGEAAVPLLGPAWRLGSRPASRARAESVLPAALDVPSAGQLVWQHEYRAPNGRTAGSLPLAEIDRRIRVAGAAAEPSVLYLTLGPTPHSGAGPLWRSLTTVLSPAGRDLRSYQYLEFYVRGLGPADAIVVDLGTVSEDAFAFDASGATAGVDVHGRAWGEGVLDQEWDATREAWSATTDERGLWNADCRAEPGGVYPLGDARASCARGNGLPDGEDLNGNGVLDTEERVFRFVVRAAAAGGGYVAADTAETGTGFRLVRIPLDAAAGVGSGPDELRRVRHLRLTVVGGAGEARLALARMRLVGTQWERRDGSGVLDGLIGGEAAGAAAGRVEVGPVGRLTAGPDYVSPPGATDTPLDPAAIGAQYGLEYNEQALRVRYAALAPGERAEVYRRYPAGPQSFLGYRELRLWALAREGAWGEGGEQLVVRVGTDAQNHYLFRTRLRPAGAPRSAEDWRPEVVIELDRWVRLRAEAERALLDAGPAGRGPLVLWDADSTYAVVIGERGRAPSLAAVREVAIAVWNGGPAAAAGELWVNDLRLGAAQRAAGLAGGIAVGLHAGDVLQLELRAGGRDGHYRQLDAPAGYVGEDAVSLGGAVQLGRLLPAGWAVDAPLRFGVERAVARPVFLEGTDLDVRSLDGVRRLGGSRSHVQLRLARREPSAARWQRATLDGLALELSAARDAEATPYTEAQGTRARAALHYEVRPAPRSLWLLPAALRPGRWLGRSPDATRPGSGAGLRVRWTPVHLSLGAVWSEDTADYRRYEGLLPIAKAEPPARPSASRTLLRQAAIAVQPLESLTGSLQLRTTGELLGAAELNPLAAPQLEAARQHLWGLNLGIESERSVASRLDWAPRLAPWLSVRAGLQGSFALDANPAYLGGPAADTGAVLLRSFGQRRTLSSRWTLEPAALARALGLPDSAHARGWQRSARAVVDLLRTVELGWGSALESRYDRTAGRPGLAYQLGLGDRHTAAAQAEEGPALLADRTSRSARAQLALPGALGFTLGYVETDGRRGGTRGERFDAEREWPSVRLDWTGRPWPALLGAAIRNTSISAGYARHVRQLDAPGSLQRHADRRVRLPVDLAVHWQAGITSAYRGEWRWGETDGPTAATGEHAADHLFTLGGSFRARGALAPLFPAPLALSLRYAVGDLRECRLAVASAACSEPNVFGGQRSRAWGLQVDTRASGMTLGLQLEHRDRREHAGLRAGHRHFSLGLFGQFDLSTGTIP